MITEVLLILTLYLILFLVWWRFRHLINIRGIVENIVTDDDFFGDIVDTPIADIEQHTKRECLKGHKQGQGKQSHLFIRGQGKVNKASGETVNKTYTEYQQRELDERVKKVEKPEANMSLNFIQLEVLKWLKLET